MPTPNIYIYIYMFQSSWRVMRQMLWMSSGQLDIACIRGKKDDINTVQFLTQTDCFISIYRQESQGLIWICLCMLFLLKDSVPIDCHYMTDRLQRFELKTFVCVLLKK